MHCCCMVSPCRKYNLMVCAAVCVCCSVHPCPAYQPALNIFAAFVSCRQSHSETSNTACLYASCRQVHLGDPCHRMHGLLVSFILFPTSPSCLRHLPMYVHCQLAGQHVQICCLAQMSCSAAPRCGSGKRSMMLYMACIASSLTISRRCKLCKLQQMHWHGIAFHAMQRRHTSNRAAQ